MDASLILKPRVHFSHWLKDTVVSLVCKESGLRRLGFGVTVKVSHQGLQFLAKKPNSVLVNTLVKHKRM